MKCKAKLGCNQFSMNISVLAVVFHRQVSKNQQFCLKFLVFENCHQNTLASTKRLTENYLRRNFALHCNSYLSIALPKILLHSKTIKNDKKLSVYGECNSPKLSKFLQTHIF